MPPDDQELLDRARAGEPEALEALLARHQDRVFRFTLKMCRHAEDAQDVLQETLLAVARTVRSFRGEASLSTWLYTIARSFCIKKRRRSRHAPASVVSLDDAEGAAAREIPAAGATPHEAVERAQLASALEKAVAALPAGQREVLLLRDVEGLPASEVAAITGLRVAAVKSRLHRARLAVRERLAPLLRGEAPPHPTRPGCPDVARMLSRHLEGEIRPEACAEMERHLEGCSSCAGECETLRRTLGLCRAIPAPAVPKDVQESVRAAIRSVLANESRQVHQD